MSTQHRTPDARQLSDEELPEGRFPAAQSDFRVFFDPATHEKIVQHASEDKSVEICGVLVGRWEHDAAGPFAVVSDYIRCDEAAKKSGEVTFTHDAWTTINREMDNKFVNLKIVGWYHSHPGFGVFLSERDVFIHEHFFSNSGQVAFVVDPTQHTEGLFVWRNGKPKPCSHYWVGDRICTMVDEQPPAGTPSQSQTVAAKPSDNAGASDVSFAALLFRALPLVAVFMIGYLLADMKSGWDQRRIIEGTVAHFGTWKCLRPGLREHLNEVAENAKAIQAAVRELADQHVKASGDDAAKVKARWSEVQNALRSTRENLYILSKVYGLDPIEEEILKARLADKVAEVGTPVVEKSVVKEKSAADEKSVTKDAPASTPKDVVPSQPQPPKK